METNYLNSFSFNLTYTAAEQKNISLKTRDGQAAYTASINREQVFQFTLDIQMATRKTLDDQSASVALNTMPREHPAPSQGNGFFTNDMFGEKDYWGVEKTAKRIVDFVLAGAGDDLEKFKAGREGVVRGLKEAEKAWGGTLPGISYDTIDKTLTTIDEKINDLGGNLVNIAV